MRLLAFITFIWCLGIGYAHAQQTADSIPTETTDTVPLQPKRFQPRPFTVLDSVAAAMANHERHISDSLSMIYLKLPDTNRRNQFVDQMLRQHLNKSYGFMSMPLTTSHLLREGHSRRTRNPEILIIIISLVLYTALLNRAMSKDVSNVWQSFYSKRILSQVSKEESLLNSWAFVGLFVLFGLTFGLFIYQLTAYYDVFYSISGMRLFGFFSLLIIILFAAKLVLLRFIGFVFNISRLVGEYISILYLTYFNITFVFLPVSVCLSLLAAQYIPYMLGVALFIVVTIFIWQYLRSSVNIISSFRFHKFYLFIYLCALEICPILILIKALNI